MINLPLIRLGILHSISIAKKNPVNFWLSTLSNLFFYFAQAIFWWVLSRNSNFAGFMRQDYILIFFVTVALTDNLYLMLFGQSGMELQRRVKELRLDSHLLLPVNIPLYYVITTISLEHLLLTLAALLLFIALHLSLSTPIWLVLIHLLLIAEGTVILAAISWIYRASTFWSNALVNVRYSNPCFKVLIRPLDSFSGVIRLFFMFVIPCLFITGVPAYLIGQQWVWSLFVAQQLITVAMVWLANKTFIVGSRRYGRVVT